MNATAEELSYAGYPSGVYARISSQISRRAGLLA